VIWAAVLAASMGTGLWLIARALAPSPRPLRVLSEELVAPRAARAAKDSRVVPGGEVRRRWQAIAGRLGGQPSPRLAADLAVLERTPERHMLDKLGYAAVFFALALVPAALAPVLGVELPFIAAAVGVALFAAAGWLYPDVEVRSRAVAARRAWAQALTVYVDIVGISLAGGAGVEDALMVAAHAGTGPQFERLDATLRAAQTRRRKLWHALDELGEQADILPLRELASAVDLAAESGSRIRETLLAKANAMRIRQLTDAEADAQRASETMGVAPALMAVAAVVLIAYPALARFFSG
jgi:tight adherence protein C